MQVLTTQLHTFKRIDIKHTNKETMNLGIVYNAINTLFNELIWIVALLKKILCNKNHITARS